MIDTSVTRAMSILELLVVNRSPMTVAEIAKKLEINRATVYNLLGSMVAKGYVTRMENGKCGLTSRIFEMGTIYQNSFPVVHLFKRADLSFADVIPSTVKLAVLSSNEAAIILHSRSTVSTPEVLPIGFTMPLHTSAIGKTLLAYSPRSTVDHVLGGAELKKFTTATMTDKEELRRELEEVKKRGLAYDRGEYADNLFCLAAPVFEKNHDIAAAVSVSGTPEQINAHLPALREGLVQVTRELSLSLGASIHELMRL